MNNTYVAKVTVEVGGYMEDTTAIFDKYFTVSAESESDAYAKINDYYNSRNSEYSTYYTVRDVDFFIHIN